MLTKAVIPQPVVIPNEPSLPDLNTETTPLEVIAPNTEAEYRAKAHAKIMA